MRVTENIVHKQIVIVRNMKPKNHKSFFELALLI